MAITIGESFDGRHITLQVSGRFDFATHQDFTHAYKQFPKGEKGFVVDLSNADYMDSSALGMLLQLREHSGKDVGVTLANGNRGIREFLRTAHFDKLFTLV